MSEILTLIKNKIEAEKYPVSFDVLREFEDSLLINNANVNQIYNKNKYTSLLYKIIFTKAGVSLPTLNYKQKRDKIYFSIQMGPDFGKVLPYCISNKNTFAYFFDIWPHSFDQMSWFLKNSSINHIFLSSQYAANFFNIKGFHNISWMPEGIAAYEYNFLPYDCKDIDVLELGRKHQLIHKRISNELAQNKKKHLYERSIGHIIFPDRESFIQGMARSKISICFPKNETHPHLAGSISTMTNRYLQSMASKCLIVGSTPHEMKELFGYDPVIQIDHSNPAEQLLDILDHYDQYYSLIEKNYQNVLMHHTLSHRWERILEITRSKIK